MACPSILASQSDLILHVEAFLSFDWLTSKGHLASGYGGDKDTKFVSASDLVKYDKNVWL